MDQTTFPISQNLSLERLVGDALGEIERLGYSRRSRGRYRATWEHLIEFSGRKELGDQFSGRGEIRDLYMMLGATDSKLGYPIADETFSPDGAGRMSMFENGEIWWYADKGAFVVDSGKTKLPEKNQGSDRRVGQ